MPLGSRIIPYVRDGRTDRQTDKSNAYCPFPTDAPQQKFSEVSAGLFEEIGFQPSSKPSTTNG